MRRKFVPALALSFWAAGVSAQNCPTTPSAWPSPASFSVTATLPDPFTYMDGSRVTSIANWYECRQPEILRMLQQYQYGTYPDHSAEQTTATRSGNTLTITVAAGGRTGQFTASISLPSSASASSPMGVVIGIGTLNSSPYINAGVAVVTFTPGNVAADSNTKSGAFWSLYNGRDIGVLTAWAWGAHRIIDAIALQVPQIDINKVGVTGCSRYGKAAFAAALFDERVLLSMPMSGGIQGPGPYRHWGLSGQGENLENSKSGAPWWTTSVLGGFVNQHERLPFDAHTIAAAIAPRGLIMDQGQSDPYVNSRGTAVITFPAAKVVYDWLGVSERIGLGIRSGGHCDAAGDTNILPFVSNVFNGTPTTRNYNSLSPWTAMAEAYPWSSRLPVPSASTVSLSTMSPTTSTSATSTTTSFTSTTMSTSTSITVSSPTTTTTPTTSSSPPATTSAVNTAKLILFGNLGALLNGANAVVKAGLGQLAASLDLLAGRRTSGILNVCKDSGEGEPAGDKDAMTLQQEIHCVETSEG